MSLRWCALPDLCQGVKIPRRRNDRSIVRMKDRFAGFSGARASMTSKPLPPKLQVDCVAGSTSHHCILVGRDLNQFDALPLSIAGSDSLSIIFF